MGFCMNNEKIIQAAIIFVFVFVVVVCFSLTPFFFHSCWPVSLCVIYFTVKSFWPLTLQNTKQTLFIRQLGSVIK
jgi:hypothetical protein